MRFKLRKKLLLFLSATLFIVTGVLGVHVAKTAQAEDVSAPVLTVEKNNLSYSDSLYILYAVSNEGFDRTQHEIKMLFWENEQKEYIIGTQDYEQTTEGYVEVDEKDCLVFYSDGIAAKEMTTDIYARACVEVDGVTYYSEVEKFSVLEYVYTAREIGGLTEEQENLFDAMLTYGTAAQILFDYKTDRLANEIYYKITVENGTLSDGTTMGRFSANETAVLVAATAPKGKKFSHWVDELGVDLEGNEITVTGNKTYTAVYQELGIIYELSADGAYAIVKDYEGTKTSLIIEDLYQGVPVTEIQKSAFSNCKQITSIKIPNSVTRIGNEAFLNCWELENVNIPNKLVSIGKRAFQSTKISNVVLPECLTEIGDAAFMACNNLTEIIIPSGVSSLDWCNFAYCENLKSVTIRSGITKVGYGAFEGCAALKDVSIPNSVKIIEDFAFLRCNSLIKVTIPDSVTNLGGAFYECANLTTIVIPRSVIVVEDFAFDSCEKLTIYCEMESQPTTWESYWNYTDCPVYWYSENKPALNANGTAFNGNFWRYVDGQINVWDDEELCSEGLSYELYDNAYYVVTGIGDCEDSQLRIPSTYNGLPVTEIEGGAFEECYQVRGVVLPNSITKIGGYAFANTFLTDIVFGSGLTSIDERAFLNAGLTSVTIPNNVTSIGVSAFFACGALSTVVIGDGLETLSDNIFSGCYSLEKVDLGNNVTTIGNSAFSGCSVLKTINMPEGLTSIGENAFNGCNELEYIELGNNVQSIGSAAFKNCYRLTDIFIPGTVTYVNDLFNGCSKLESVIIGEGVTSLNMTFYTCTALREVELPSSLQSIGSYTFYDCGSLVNITIPDNVTYIGEYAFQLCTGLTSITLPDKVTSLGAYAFSGCSALSDLKLGGGITTFGRYVFQGCKGLTSLTLPQSATKVESYAFYDCANLTTLVIPAATTVMGSYVFQGCYKLTIYCKSVQQPNGWSASWNGNANRPIFWGYTGEEYTYRFETNGGNVIKNVVSNLPIDLPVPTKEGNHFMGWYDNTEFVGEPCQSPYYKANATLYAKWMTEEEFAKIGTSFEYAIEADCGTYEVVIDQSGEKVYFKFTPTESRSYTIKSSGNYDSYGHLYNSAKTQITYDDESAGSGNFKMTYNLVAGQSYYIVARMYSTYTTGTFTITIA